FGAWQSSSRVGMTVAADGLSHRWFFRFTLHHFARGKSSMRISDAAKQAIDVQAKTIQTQQAIAAAVLKKQSEVDKSSAQSIVQLLESVASPPSRGLDLKA
ncbi:MAG: hypothetical protein ACK53L_33415, partial [Pirellulaceae bacterium]